MTTEIKALIAKVRELDKAATPGPWGYGDGQLFKPGMVPTLTDTETGRVFHSPVTWKEQEDDRLTAHYRTAAPLLANALEIALEALHHIGQEGRIPGTTARLALEKIAKLRGET